MRTWVPGKRNRFLNVDGMGRTCEITTHTFSWISHNWMHHIYFRTFACCLRDAIMRHFILLFYRNFVVSILQVRCWLLNSLIWRTLLYYDVYMQSNIRSVQIKVWGEMAKSSMVEQLNSQYSSNRSVSEILSFFDGDGEGARCAWEHSRV